MSNRLSTGAELTKAGTDLTKCHLTRGRNDHVPKWLEFVSPTNAIKQIKVCGNRCFNAADGVFKPKLSQTKDYNMGMCSFSEEQRLVRSESG
jgi:hypothetical protein